MASEKPSPAMHCSPLSPVSHHAGSPVLHHCATSRSFASQDSHLRRLSDVAGDPGRYKALARHPPRPSLSRRASLATSTLREEHPPFMSHSNNGVPGHIPIDMGYDRRPRSEHGPGHHQPLHAAQIPPQLPPITPVTPSGGARVWPPAHSSASSPGGSTGMMQYRRESIDDDRARRKGRTATACAPCHRRKQKCDGEIPCRRCTERGVTDQCSYSTHHDTPYSRERSRAERRHSRPHPLPRAFSHDHGQVGHRQHQSPLLPQLPKQESANHPYPPFRQPHHLRHDSSGSRSDQSCTTGGSHSRDEGQTFAQHSAQSTPVAQWSTPMRSADVTAPTELSAVLSQPSMFPVLRQPVPPVPKLLDVLPAGAGWRNPFAQSSSYSRPRIHTIPVSSERDKTISPTSPFSGTPIVSIHDVPSLARGATAPSSQETQHPDPTRSLAAPPAGQPDSRGHRGSFSSEATTMSSGATAASGTAAPYNVLLEDTLEPGIDFSTAETGFLGNSHFGPESATRFLADNLSVPILNKRTDYFRGSTLMDETKVYGHPTQVRELLAFLPDEDMCHQLVSAYFEMYNRNFDFLYKPSFEDVYTSFWDTIKAPDCNASSVDLRHLALIFAVMAIGVLVDSTPATPAPSRPGSAKSTLTGYFRTPTPGLMMHGVQLTAMPRSSSRAGVLSRMSQKDREEYSLKWSFAAKRALSEASSFYSESIETVAASGLLALYLVTCRRVTEGWRMINQAINAAHAQGMHQDGIKWCGMSCKEAETRRRLWAQLYVLDRSASLFLGRPSSIVDGRFSTIEPANITDAQLLELPERSIRLSQPDGTPISGAQQVARPLDQPTKSTFLILHYRLARIIGVVQDKCFGLTDRKISDVLACEEMFMAFRDNLPPHFRLDESVDTSLDDRPGYEWLRVQRLSLISKFHLARVTLHRPYITALKNPKTAASRKACIESSLADLRLRINSDSQDPLDRFKWLTVASGFNSATVVGMICIYIQTFRPRNDLLPQFQDFTSLLERYIAIEAQSVRQDGQLARELEVLRLIVDHARNPGRAGRPNSREGLKSREGRKKRPGTSSGLGPTSSGILSGTTSIGTHAEPGAAGTDATPRRASSVQPTTADSADGRTRARKPESASLRAIMHHEDDAAYTQQPYLPAGHGALATLSAACSLSPVQPSDPRGIGADAADEEDDDDATACCAHTPPDDGDDVRPSSSYSYKAINHNDPTTNCFPSTFDMDQWEAFMLDQTLGMSMITPADLFLEELLGGDQWSTGLGMFTAPITGAHRAADPSQHHGGGGGGGGMQIDPTT